MHLVQKRFFDLKNNAISTDMIFKADLSWLNIFPYVDPCNFLIECYCTTISFL